MPTKHIDDSTAAELDELYVRCVTLTQQPVKEVEVLRLAIQKGIKNIADNDILASMAVKNTVWKGLADKVWNEVIACWPQDAIAKNDFWELAQAHSQTWQSYPSESCRKALFNELEKEHIEISNSKFITPSALFQDMAYDMTAEEEQAAREENKRLSAEYVASLPALEGRLYSALSSHEKALAQHYTKEVGFKPDGNGDFLVKVQSTEDSQ